MNKTLFALLLGLLTNEGRCQVHILSTVSAPVKKFTSETYGLAVEDGGGYFSVSLINTSDKILLLPSKLPPPDIVVPTIALMSTLRCVSPEEMLTRPKVVGTHGSFLESLSFPWSCDQEKRCHCTPTPFR